MKECVFQTKYTRAPYLMKTDDDTFVRVDEVLEAVITTEITRGLVYGSIEDTDLTAHNKSSPWYSSEEVHDHLHTVNTSDLVQH